MSRSATPNVQWKIHVPQALALRIESRIFDATKGKPKYGQRNTLIVALLEKYDRETPLPEWMKDGKLPFPSLPEPQIP